MIPKTNNQQAVIGALLGCAVGDALGLPYEGLSKRRARKMLGEPDRYRFFLGRGMVSDDTEHSCMTAAALIASGGDPDLFSRHLARELRWWLLALPAGVGFATLRAILLLWLGFGPSRSGVYSAGNGPAMRSPIIGAAVNDIEQLAPLVRACTRITHTDPKAYYGAYAVALAAHLARAGSKVEPKGFQQRLAQHLPECSEEFRDLIDQVVRSVETGMSLADFATELNQAKGISGYVYHSVPICLHCWLTHQGDYKSAVMEIIRQGGDADTTAAIVGGIVGASVRASGIPAPWLAKLIEYPRSSAWMKHLGRATARATAEHKKDSVPGIFWPFIPIRNLFFLCVVLFHGFRRLLPPY